MGLATGGLLDLLDSAVGYGETDVSLGCERFGVIGFDCGGWYLTWGFWWWVCLRVVGAFYGRCFVPVILLAYGIVCMTRSVGGF